MQIYHVEKTEKDIEVIIFVNAEVSTEDHKIDLINQKNTSLKKDFSNRHIA